jgi:hypothetical protein
MILIDAGIEPSSLVEEAEELLRVRDEKPSLALPPLELTNAERWTFLLLSRASSTHPHRSVHALVLLQNICLVAMLHESPVGHQH